jgi:hypothetical protein
LGEVKRWAGSWETRTEAAAMSSEEGIWIVHFGPSSLLMKAKTAGELKVLMGTKAGEEQNAHWVRWLDRVQGKEYAIIDGAAVNAIAQECNKTQDFKPLLNMHDLAFWKDGREDAIMADDLVCPKSGTKVYIATTPPVDFNTDQGNSVMHLYERPKKEEAAPAGAPASVPA